MKLAAGPSPSPAQAETPLSPEAGHKGKRRLLLAGFSVWALVEAALLLFRTGYPFPQLGLLDSWFYTSFQWDLPRQMQEFGNSYYSARMSLYLPGTLLHAVLPPVAAVIVYKLLISAGTTFAWAFVCHRAAGPRAALLAAAVDPLVPWFIVARHNDYMDIGVVLYGALTAAATMGLSGSPRPWAWRIAVGFFFGAMLISNLSAAASVGLGLVVFHLLQDPEPWMRRVRSGLEVVVGFALACALFGLASKLAGGPVWIFGPQIEALFFIGGLEKNPWAPTDWAWFPAATWLAVPLAALVWGLVSARRVPEHRTLRALLGGHAVALVGALVLEALGMGVLYHWFYALFHYVLALPLLITCASLASSARAAAGALAWGAPLALVLLGGAAASWLTFVQIRLGLPGGAGTLAFALAAVAPLLTLLGSMRRTWAREGILAVIVLCSTPIGFNLAAQRDRLRERYLLVHDAFHEINRRFETNRYRLWFDPEFGGDGLSLAASKLYGLRLLTLRPFPDVERERTTDLPIVVPTKPGQALQRFAAVQARHTDTDFSAPTVYTVHSRGGLGVDLLVFTMQTRFLDPENPPAGSGPFTRLMELQPRDGASYRASLDAVIHHPGAEPALYNGPTHPYLRRTAPNDHVATAFVPLPPGEDRDVFAVLELDGAADGFFVLQTDGFHNVGPFPLGKPGRLIQRAQIRDDAKSIRIYFQSNVDSPMPLPRRIALYIASSP